jgi:acetyl esterase/lipase
MLLRILAWGSAGLTLAAAALLFHWTHTPHGRMDLGAALVVHSLPSGGITAFTPEARRQTNGWTQRFMGDAEPTVAVRALSFPGPAGELPLRLYTPPGEGPFPVVAWIHGGGFWMGDDLPMWDGTCSRLALASGAIVASIGYRLAPEDPFPAAVDDSFAGLRFVAAHAREWGGDASRLAVMGGSAGGNLAAVMALRARDEGGPALRYQVLLVPVVAVADDATESRQMFASGYGLDGVAAMMAAYLPNASDRSRPWAAPLLAERLDGLPPALILTAEFDPLRDEGERYAERLRASGVAVTLRRFDGAIHGFLGSTGDRAESEALAAEKLREALR